MGGKREVIYLSLPCHYQNDSCTKKGSDESHFNVSLIVRDKVTRQCPQTTTFEEEGESKRIRTEVPHGLTSGRDDEWTFVYTARAVVCSRADSFGVCLMQF